MHIHKTIIFHENPNKIELEEALSIYYIHHKFIDQVVVTLFTSCHYPGGKQYFINN